MGFLRKLMGGSAEQGPKVPTRAQPETIEAAEQVWQTMQDLVDEFNKGGPSGSLVGLPLPRRVKLRDDTTVIGERLGTNRARVKALQRSYTSKQAGAQVRDLATAAAQDPFCELPLDPSDPQSPTIAQRCAEFADEVENLEREVAHTRKIERDRQRL